MLTESLAAAPQARAGTPFDGQAEISARLERLPITRRVFWTRNIIGAATFFDGYTVIAIAYAMPVLVREWGLNPQQTGWILSVGYLGQLFGAVLFGWLAERHGRLKVLLFTILLFVSMDVACLFATGGHDLRALVRNGHSDAQISTVIGGIWRNRTDQYSELRTANTDTLRAERKVEMSYIGG